MNWRKLSEIDIPADTCIEFAKDGEHVYFRSSKDPTQRLLVAPYAEWYGECLPEILSANGSANGSAGRSAGVAVGTASYGRLRLPEIRSGELSAKRSFASRLMDAFEGRWEGTPELDADERRTRRYQERDIAAEQNANQLCRKEES